MIGIEDQFKKLLGKGEDFAPDWKSVIDAIDVASETDQLSYDAFVTAASDRLRLMKEDCL